MPPRPGFEGGIGDFRDGRLENERSAVQRGREKGRSDCERAGGAWKRERKGGESGWRRWREENDGFAHSKSFSSAVRGGGDGGHLVQYDRLDPLSEGFVSSLEGSERRQRVLTRGDGKEEGGESHGGRVGTGGLIEHRDARRGRGGGSGRGRVERWEEGGMGESAGGESCGPSKSTISLLPHE
jgi:hypothetical protein